MVNTMQTKRFTAMLLIAALVVPLSVQGILSVSALSVSASASNTSLVQNAGWKTVNTGVITVEFPRNGSKPMFLWWYNGDPDSIYVVRFDRLTEYYTFQTPYYNHLLQADNLTIQQLQQVVKDAVALSKLQDIIADINNLWGHPANLPFSACRWTLQGPTNITANDGKTIGLTFTFNMTGAPKPFSFAVNNVAIRIRFYYVPVTENVGNNLYNYTVGANEMKMDFIVKNWKWNLDLVQPLLNNLIAKGINVPHTSTSLALGIHLSSLNLTETQGILNNPDDSALQKVEILRQILIGNQPSINLNNNRFDDNETPITITRNIRDFYKLSLASNNQTLGGYFKFVASALVDNSSGTFQVPVKGSYSAHGASLNLYLCYPYFNGTLIHDPSIGVDTPTTSANVPSYQVSVGTTPTATVSATLTAPQILTTELVVILTIIASTVTAGLVYIRSKGRNILLRSL